MSSFVDGGSGGDTRYTAVMLLLCLVAAWFAVDDVGLVVLMMAGGNSRDSVNHSM